MNTRAVVVMGVGNRYLGGKLPFGWQRGQNGELLPDTAQQQAVERMRALQVEGLSRRAIAASMAATGVAVSHVGVKNALLAQAARAGG